MKNHLLFCVALAVCAQLQAQTNTFPGSGNVGIGTTNPAAPLAVAADGGSTSVALRVERGAGNTARLELNYQQIQKYDGNGNYNNLLLNPNGGNVGIGTTGPVAPLTIAADGGSTSVALRVERGAGNTARLELNYEQIQKYDGNGNYNNLLLNPSGGNVGIGTTSPTQKLDVAGAIHAHEVIVDTNGADYVFASNYKLMSLPEVEQAIQRDKHLPGIPSAQEMNSGGMNMGEMQAKLLAKVEELTLHQIEQEKLLAAQQTEIAALRAEVAQLKQP